MNIKQMTVSDLSALLDVMEKKNHLTKKEVREYNLAADALHARQLHSFRLIRSLSRRWRRNVPIGKNLIWR